MESANMSGPTQRERKHKSKKVHGHCISVAIMFQLYLVDYATTFYTHDNNTYYVTLLETCAHDGLCEEHNHTLIPVSLQTLYAMYRDMEGYRDTPLPNNFRKDYGDDQLSIEV